MTDDRQIRAVSAPVPSRPDGRPIIAWQLDGAASPRGPWRPVNAGQTSGESTELMTGRFRADENHVRVTFVAAGGSWNGGVTIGQPARLAANGAITELAATPRGAGRIVR